MKGLLNIFKKKGSSLNSEAASNDSETAGTIGGFRCKAALLLLIGTTLFVNLKGQTAYVQENKDDSIKQINIAAAEGLVGLIASKADSTYSYVEEGSGDLCTSYTINTFYPDKNIDTGYHLSRSVCTGVKGVRDESSIFRKGATNNPLIGFSYKRNPVEFNQTFNITSIDKSIFNRIFADWAEEIKQDLDQRDDK